MQRIMLGLIVAVDLQHTTIRGRDGLRYLALTDDLPRDTKYALANAENFIPVSFDVEEGLAIHVYLHK